MRTSLGPHMLSIFLLESDASCPLPLLDVFVERYREDFESLVFVFLPSAHHVGIFSATRPAPTCPEVDQYDFALQV